MTCPQSARRQCKASWKCVSSTALPTCVSSPAGEFRARSSSTRDRGSYEEVTLRRNRADLEALEFHQRVMVDVSTQSSRPRILGESCHDSPRDRPDRSGRAVSCQRRDPWRTARPQAFGIPFCLSTMSICSIEDVRQAVDDAVLVPALPDARPRLQRRPDRARKWRRNARLSSSRSTCRSRRMRRRDAKNGLSIPPRLTLANAFDIATKPGWALARSVG